jgi:hypothetical protein
MAVTEKTKCMFRLQNAGQNHNIKKVAQKPTCVVVD